MNIALKVVFFAVLVILKNHLAESVYCYVCNESQNGCGTSSDYLEPCNGQCMVFINPWTNWLTRSCSWYYGIMETQSDGSSKTINGVSYSFCNTDRCNTDYSPPLPEETLTTISTTISSSCSISCKNGGVLDTSICACSCLPLYSGITCESVDCDAQYEFCDTDFSLSDCAVDSIALMCPRLCNTQCSTTAAPRPTTPVITSCPAELQICQNGGTCSIYAGIELLCDCKQGFTGQFCETIITTSSSTTTTTTTKTTTTSSPTTTYTTTVAPVAACPSGLQLCQNNGECFLLNGVSILCRCASGFTGEFCETTITSTTQSTTTFTTTTTTTSTTTTAAPIVDCPATPTICLNGGQCYIIGGSSIVCSCPTNYAGKFCETALTTTQPTTTTTTTTSTTTLSTAAIQNCASSLCSNNGNCYLIGGVSVVCQCYSNYTGDFCETSLISTSSSQTVSTTTVPTGSVPCDFNYCQNDAQCYLRNGNELLCVCKQGFTGYFCEEIAA